jgi:hypothetical protein
VRRLRELNHCRDRAWERAVGGVGNDDNGCFKLSSAAGVILACIASTGEGWDHVSVSTPLRCPTWAEMEQVKRAFFRPEETAMQLHVPPAAHISVHPYCLHLWRPHAAPIPMPPSWMVG